MRQTGRNDPLSAVPQSLTILFKDYTLLARAQLALARIVMVLGRTSRLSAPNSQDPSAAKQLRVPTATKSILPFDRLTERVSMRRTRS